MTGAEEKRLPKPTSMPIFGQPSSGVEQPTADSNERRTWACRACTYINENEHPACSICATSRSEEASEEEKEVVEVATYGPQRDDTPNVSPTLGGGPFTTARQHIQGRGETLPQLQAMFKRHEATPTMTDQHGNTLLHVACKNNNKKAVKLLLRSCVDINAQNNTAQTPLHYCYAYSYTSLAAYLERKGADPMIRNEYGMLPHQCQQRGLRGESSKPCRVESAPSMPAGLHPSIITARAKLHCGFRGIDRQLVVACPYSPIAA